MTASIVKSEVTAVVAHAQMLDVALRAAQALKGARGLLPESLKSEGEIVAVLLAGQELGLPPMAALRGLQVVRGKVITSYDTMIALLRRAGYRVEWPHSDATRATLKLTHPDGSQHVETWDVERAKKAGLWGSSTWAKYPDTMLRARCVSSAARAFAGEVLAGVYIEDEMREVATPRAVHAEVVQLEPKPIAQQEPAAATVVQQREIEIDDGEMVLVPAKFDDCNDRSQLQAFCRANKEALAAFRNGQRKKVIAKCEEAAVRCGVDVQLALAWASLLEGQQ